MQGEDTVELARLCSTLLRNPGRFFAAKAREVPRSLPWVFLALALISSAIGFWIIARGTIYGQWSLRFDLVMEGLAISLGIFVLLVLLTWIGALVGGVRMRWTELFQAGGYASLPMAVAWVPGLLRAIAQSGALELTLRILAYVGAVLLLLEALRIMAAAIGSGYVPLTAKGEESVPRRRKRLQRRAVYALILPVVVGVAAVAALLLLRIPADSYPVHQLYFASPQELGFRPNYTEKKLILVYTPSASPQPPFMAISYEEMPVKGQSLDDIYLANAATVKENLAKLKEQGVYTDFSEKDMHIGGERARTLAFIVGTEEKDRAAFTMTLLTRGDFVYNITTTSSVAEVEGVAALFDQLMGEARFYSAKISVFLPGLFNRYIGF